MRSKSTVATADWKAAAQIWKKIRDAQDRFAGSDGLVYLANQLEKHVKAIEVAYATKGQALSIPQQSKIYGWKSAIASVRHKGKKSGDSKNG